MNTSQEKCRDAPLIEIRHLSVSVEGKRVLNDLDLYVMQGETIVLFGPNGSGKTSLLKTIMGIPQYRVESGNIITWARPGISESSRGTRSEA